jgi:glycosyltransferase involved in cell wall biosynthesis
MAMRGHRITLLCLAKDKPDWRGLAELRELLDDLIVIPRRSRTSIVTLAKAASAPRRPAVATVNGCNGAYAAAFANLLGQGFDVVQVEHSYAFEPFAKALAVKEIPFLLTEHNVESRLVAQQYARLPWGLRQLAALDACRSRFWERQVIRRAACVVAVTAQDKAEFFSRGARSTALVPNCIDTGTFARVSPSRTAQRLLFVGNYEYAPNVAAVRRLCEGIMPKLWRFHPNARLLVCGNAMPAEWRARWTDPKLEFAGYVKDLPSVHAASSLFIAPLTHGGGSKLKVLEAMSSALPVVGTAESMSGLEIENGRHCLIAESDEDLAHGAARILSGPGTAAQIGENGRSYVTRHHDWAIAADALECAYVRHLATCSISVPDRTADLVEATNL